MNKAVHKLNADLSRLKHAEAAEKKASDKISKAEADEKSELSSIASQEQAIFDQFQKGAVDPNAQKQLLQQLFGLGQKEIQTQDAFAKTLASDKSALAKEKKAVTTAHKQALKDLKPAEYHLSLKATNADRKELGLKALKKPVRQTSSPAEPFKPGKGTLYGADTSGSYQTDAQFHAAIKNAKWSTIKATQGTSWTDPAFKKRWAELGKKIKDGSMKLRMAYCFLDPGDGVAQAKHFLNVVGVHGKLPAGTRLTLDWESAALNSPGTLKAAADYIHKVTGTWPVIYCQESEASRAHSIVPHAPLWEAAVADSAGDALPVHDRNRNVPFFQYAWKPWDEDQFNGNLKALEKFAGWS